MPIGFRRRADMAEAGEANESAYISMTDMLVGVVFIFIIMLSYFALQFHTTTASLTSAKDAQTTALLKVAKSLETQPATLQIDRTAHVVCIPGQILTNGADTDPHCFAYTGVAPKAPVDTTRAELQNAVAEIESDLFAQKVDVSGGAASGNLVFRAEDLFATGSATLSPQGDTLARQVAGSLAQRLPCYAYGASGANCGAVPKMRSVLIVANASFDATTAEGRQAAALALDRSVAFQQALVRDAPVLGQLRDGPDAGAQPLLRAASYGQSGAATPPQGSGQTVTVQFDMPAAQ
jgi:hypothetical protein